MKRLRFAFAMLALSLPLAAAPLFGQEPVKLSIRFISEKDVKPKVPVRLATPIALGRVTDARKQDNPMLLGQSEARKPPVPVETLTPIPALVEEALRVSLAEWKVDVQPGADRILVCEILELKTEEEHRVGADVRLRFLLRNKAGAELWKGEVRPRREELAGRVDGRLPYGLQTQPGSGRLARYATASSAARESLPARRYRRRSHGEGAAGATSKP
jgi:hypothetical protein